MTLNQAKINTRKRRSIRIGRLRPAEGAIPRNRTCKRGFGPFFFWLWFL